MSFTKMGLEGREEDRAQMIDLRHIVMTIRRRKLWIAATILMVILLTIIAYITAERRYSATASLALDRRVDEIVAQQDQPLSTDSSSVDTEVQVLTSPRLVEEVVDKLKLASRPEFADGPATTPVQARKRTVKKVLNNLDATREGTSYAIAVTYTSPDRHLAANVVNTVVDQYIEDKLLGRSDERSREVSLLRSRLASLRNEVIRSEAAVARYRAATNLIDVQKDSTSVQQEISALNGQLAAAQAEAAAAQARLGAMRANGAGSTDAASSTLLRDLRSQQATLGVQRADLAGRYGTLHPDLARIDRQLADIDRSIEQETRRINASAAEDARVAQGRASSIRSSLNQATAGLRAGNSATVQLNELERSAESARTLYQTLLDRYNKAITGQGTDRSNAYVIAHAMTPGSPVSPNLPIYIAGGVIAAVFAAAGLVIVLELLENGFQSRGDIEAQLGVPVVGTVPDLATMPNVTLPKGDPMGPPDYLVANEGSFYSEAFRSIRTALQLGQSQHRVLSVSSALPGEGKTTLSISLARSAALAGQRVLLIDCDLRRRASSKSMTSSVENGLIEVLKGDVQLDEALHRDTSTNVWILPQTEAGSTNYDLVASPAMGALLDQVRPAFDLIILDTAPVLPLAEARALASIADGVLLVVRWRTTPVQAAQMAIDLLGRSGARILGVAMTIVNMKQHARSGYGDEMAYYHRFKEYYSG
ncbi:hypothetical protein BV96_04003 [Sphingomonas paucimobilis]|nr:hypothetical protein BV96_04003 [Sphingomonas paucimobilis]